MSFFRFVGLGGGTVLSKVESLLAVSNAEIFSLDERLSISCARRQLKLNTTKMNMILLNPICFFDIEL